MRTDAPTSLSLTGTGSAKPLCRQRGPEPRLPGDVFFPCTPSWSLRDALPTAAMPANCRRPCGSSRRAGKRSNNRRRSLPRASRRSTQTHGSGHWAPSCKDQAGLTGLGDRLRHPPDSQKHTLPPPQLHCNPRDTQQNKFNPPIIDFVLVVPPARSPTLARWGFNLRWDIKSRITTLNY